MPIFDTRHPRHGVIGSEIWGYFTLQGIICTYAERCSSATYVICHLVSGLRVNILQYTKQECSDLMKFYVTTCDPITLYLSEKLNSNITPNLPVNITCIETEMQPLTSSEWLSTCYFYL